jgi:HD-like signal output (HDOD) protein
MQDDHNLAENQQLFFPASFIATTPVIAVDPLPQVPTLATTRLQLELLLQESYIDLSAVSEVILSDAGATLQILRLIGEEYPDAEGRPTRIEDCLVSLNRDRWYAVLCASCLPHNSAVQAQWQHFRRVAQCARELAQCVDGVSPEEAYLVGLLSEIGRFPHLLGWNETGDSAGEHKALGVMLAEHWHLPAYLALAIQEQQEPVLRSRWSEFLQMAQQAAAHTLTSAD